jgi:ribosomal protein S18 acetylase RimI-like enzyme
MSTYGEVVVIAVHPGARNLGVGRALLERAVTDLRDREVPVIMVETGGDEGHAPARALYESAGFTRLPIAQYWLSGTP